MFKLTQTPSYWWPITHQIAKGGDKAGEIEVVDFEVEFTRFDEDAFEKLTAKIQQDKPSDRVLARNLVRNFRKVVDDQGQSVPFSADTLGDLLRVPGLGSTVVGAFFTSRRPAAEKN